MLAPFPSLTSVRAFEAAARLGSFARAAQELGTTAASVSYHVRQLEEQVGVALFHRHPQKVELTGPGALIAGEATAAFDALRAIFVRAVDLDQSRLSLTTLPTLGTAWLTPRLGRFRALHPGISVELDLSPEAQALGVGRFDAAIRNGHGRWPGLRTVKLFPSVFTPLCAPAVKEAAAAALAGPSATPEVPLLGRPDWWAIWFEAAHARPAPAEFGTTLSAEHLDVAAAIAGHGVAIASPILFRGEIEASRLARVSPIVAGDDRAFWLTWPVARQESGKIARFRDWLTAEAGRELELAAPWLKRVKLPAG